MNIEHATYVYEYEKEGVKTQYNFDTRSKDVEFVEYISNTVKSLEPYTEEVVEKWLIKPLDKHIKITRTTKYFGDVAKRRQYNVFCKDKNNYASLAEDVYFEWNPAVLDTSNIKNHAYQYEMSNGGNDLDSSNVLYFNKNNQLTDNYILQTQNKYSDLIDNVNSISNKKVKDIRKAKSKPLLNIPRLGENRITNNDNFDKMKELSSSNSYSSNNGLFVPVHLRNKQTPASRYDSASRYDPSSRNDSASRNDNIFRVPKRQHAPRYTFVFKGLPNPNDMTPDIIKQIIYTNSPTFRTIKNDRECTVYIIRDKNTGKQRNMCLIHFKTEHLKNNILDELLNTRITYDHVIINVENSRDKSDTNT
jgi:hypothetical protein